MLRPQYAMKGAAIFLALGLTAVAQQPGGPPGGFPGFFRLPKPGEILSTTVQSQLKLNGDQKKQLAEVQKDVDARLGKILTADQNKSFQKMRDRKGPNFGPPRPGGFPGFFPGGFGTVGLNDVKKAIQATDEEWKVIGPKLQKVIAARRILTTESRSADVGTTPRPGDAPTRPAPRAGENNVITQAHTEFKTVLDDPKHTPEELKEAADAVRKARDKARNDLRATQDDLRKLLTKEQETILLGLGYLD